MGKNYMIVYTKWHLDKLSHTPLYYLCYEKSVAIGIATIRLGIIAKWVNKYDYIREI